MWNQALGVQVEIQNIEFKERLEMMDKLSHSIGWGADPMTFLDMWETNNGNNTTLYFPTFGPDWEMKWTYIEGKK